MIIYLLIIIPVLFITIGIFYNRNNIKIIDKAIIDIKNFHDNLCKMWNKFSDKNILDEKLYNYSIENSDNISKMVNTRTSKIYRIKKYSEAYTGINLIKEGIPYIRLSSIDDNINKDVLQEIILDIDNILISRNGEFTNLLKEEKKKSLNPFKLLYIGYTKIYDEIVELLSIDYLKLKAETIKKLLTYIYSIVFIWYVIKYFIS